MKKAIVTLTVAVFTMLLSTATIRTVSNNASSPGHSTSLPTAIASSSVGDTLYIQGSPTSYGNVIIDKKLTLIGSGYAPDSTDYNLATTITQITLDTTGLYLLQGLKIIGVSLYNTGGSSINYSTSPTNDRGLIHNISFERCYIYTYSTAYISGNNWSFLNCVFNYPNTGGYPIDIGNYDNIIITNCFFVNTYINNSNKSSVNLYNSIFLNYSGNFFNSNVSNMGIYNCIFYNSNPGGCTNCLFMNNIVYDDATRDLQIPAVNSGSGNFVNSNPLFVQTPTAHPAIGTTINYSDLKTYNWHLQSGSPGHNAGTDATDIGFYGGAYPYKNLTGMNPKIPIIRSFIVKNPVAQKGGTLQISIKAQKLQ
jgi:hypothetical protein